VVQQVLLARGGIWWPVGLPKVVGQPRQGCWQQQQNRVGAVNRIVAGGG